MPTPLAVEQMPWHLASPFNGMENGRVSPPLAAACRTKPAAPNSPRGVERAAVEESNRLPVQQLDFVSCSYLSDLPV